MGISESKLIKEFDETRKNIFVLVGPPSVGKSTWIRNHFRDGNPYIINRDELVEKIASGYGWTYDDMFASPAKEEEIGATDEKYGNVVASPSWMTWSDKVFDKVLEANGKVQSEFMNKVSGAVPSGKDIVVDMTNMSAGARKGALKAIEGSEGEYEKIAVVFKFQGGEDVIKQMAAKRAAEAKAQGKSKTIPDAAFDRMFKSFQNVSPEEGFDQIIDHDTIDALKQGLMKDIERSEEEV